MGLIKSNSPENQQRRLAIKTIHQQMSMLAMDGVGLSKWEAKELTNIIDDVYFTNSNLQDIKEGQVKYSCTSAQEGPGKPLADCQMVTVILTLFDPEDSKGLPAGENKQRQVRQRMRRCIRLCQEAKDQGGLLTQEDLAQLLQCDSKTIQRLVKVLKQSEICLPTRGNQKDIGPGVTHRELVIRKWIEGHEPAEVAKLTKHSIGAVENYLQKFKVIVFLHRERKFTPLEISVVAGVSISATKVFTELYESFKNHSTFKYRLEDINIAGKSYYNAVGEKKDSPLVKPSKQEWS
jgi:hypothetical protein